MVFSVMTLSSQGSIVSVTEHACAHKTSSLTAVWSAKIHVKHIFYFVFANVSDPVNEDQTLRRWGLYIWITPNVEYQNTVKVM